MVSICALHLHFFDHVCRDHPPSAEKGKEHDALLKKLKIGDKVSTASGIVGVITQIKQNSVSLRSADSKLEMLLPSVDRVLKEKDSPEA